MLALLAVVMMASVATAYDRSEFGGWIDADKDCQDTRQEVLIEESLIPVTFTDEKNCRVATGLWVCPYTGQVFYEPSDLDIDHTVPLRAAWDSGAESWSKSRKKEYFNSLDDENHLMAVWKSSNRSKGAKDPSKWMPPNRNFWTMYVAMWVTVKVRWNLEIDEHEELALNYLFKMGEVYSKGDLIPYPTD